MKSSTCLLLGALLAAPGAHAAAPRAAVFPFELVDTSAIGYVQADHTRLAQLDSQLREGLAQSGRYDPIAVPNDPTGPDLRTCNGCETDLARKIGAQVSVIGWVQKVSNLILNINIVMREVATGKPIAAGSVDIRGDTDESWQRGLAWLLRNRILVPPDR